MGKGMVRAVVATVKRKNMMLVRQDNSSIVVVRCRACEQLATHKLPSSIPALTKFIKETERAHRNCLFRQRPAPQTCPHGMVPTICSICEGHPVL